MAINSLSAASRGFSGLASGINTQETVEKLLSGTQGRMDRANQRKTVLQYKQSMYNDVAASLRGLQTNFMSFTSKTNLMSNSFFNSMNAVMKPPTGIISPFSVTATSSAKPGNVTVNKIEQLASASYAETAAQSGTGDVKGTMNSAVAGTLLDQFMGTNNSPDAQLLIQIGGQTITIDNAPKTFEGKSPSEVADHINTLLGAAGTARFTNNKLEITAANSEEFVKVSGPAAADKKLAMKMFGGFNELSGKGKLSAEINTERYKPSLVFELDGRREEIRISFAALEDAKANNFTKIGNELTQALQSKFGDTVVVTQTGSELEFKSKAGDTSRKFTIYGTAEMMGTLGLKTGISNKLNAAMSIKDLNFKEELQGNLQKFSINGVEFSFNSSTSLSTIMETINSSSAGVKVSYNETKDSFRIESKETGAGQPDIKMSQTDGNLLSSLFGIPGGTHVTALPVTKPINGGSITGTVLAEIKHGGTFTFNVNGRNHTFKINKKVDDTEYTASEFTAALNQKFEDAFGKDINTVARIEFKFDGTDKFSIVSNNKAYEVTTTALDTEKNTSLLGFTDGDSTVAHKGTTSLADLGVNLAAGSQFELEVNGTSLTVAGLLATDSLADIATKLTSALQMQLAGNPLVDESKFKVVFDEQEGAFKVESQLASDGTAVTVSIKGVNGAGGSGMENLLGENGVQVQQAGAPLVTNAGKNAVAYIDGQRIERNSNSFTMDGLTFSLHSTTFVDQTTQTGPHHGDTIITTSRDTEQITEGITEYLKEYNEMINTISGMYRADKTYKDYPPLTAAQKKDMSEREIEQWEEKAKGGLLRSDHLLEKVLQTLRTSMFNKPEGSGIALYDLGIDTNGFGKDGNFTMESESKLKAAIENDPEAVRKLFAGEGGIMEKLNDAINDAANSYGGAGYLLREAGVTTTDTEGAINKQIKDIDRQLSSLQLRYQKEYDRYWKQFTNMEKAIQNMNTQSAWLTQQFSS